MCFLREIHLCVISNNSLWNTDIGSVYSSDVIINDK